MSELITTMFATLQSALLGFIEAFKLGFLEAIYVDPSATTPVVSELATFGFIMLGLSLAITLTFGLVRMVKGRGSY